MNTKPPGAERPAVGKPAGVVAESVDGGNIGLNSALVADVVAEGRELVITGGVGFGARVTENGGNEYTCAWSPMDWGTVTVGDDVLGVGVGGDVEGSVGDTVDVTVGRVTTDVGSKTGWTTSEM